MDPVWKEKWTDALRGGDYRQGKYYLKNVEGTNCCLGVLCDLVDPGAWGVDEDGQPHFGDAYSTPDGETLGMVGLAFKDVTRLVTFNDSDGLSFSEIADWVEENL